MHPKKQQRGLGLIMWLVVIAIAIFFGMVGIKSIPVYLNHYKVVSILHSISNQSSVSQMSNYDLKIALERRFDIDMVKYLGDREVKVVGSEGSSNRKLVAQYEVRVPMFYNVDAVYSFDEQVPIK